MKTVDRSSQHDRIAQLCRWLLAAVLGASIWALMTLSQTGFHIDTSLSDMSPAVGDSEAIQDALNHTQQLAEQSVILLLQGDDADQIDAAANRVFDLVSEQHFEARIVEESVLIDALMGQLQSYRFYLLSPGDRKLLENQQTSQLLDQTLSELYAPGETIRPLPFDEDPLNFFGHWLLSVELTLGAPVVKSISTENLQHRVINIQLTGDYTDANNQQQLIDNFAVVSTTINEEHPNVTALRSGVLFFASQSAESAQQDINLISFGSLVGLCLLLLVVFRSLWPLIIPVISIAIGLFTAFVVVHVMFGAVHVFTIVFGASLMGLVIDYSIHYFFHERSRAEVSVTVQSDNSCHSSRYSLYRALVLSLLTSVFGFSALTLTTVPSLLKIAVFSVVGLVTAWLTVISLGSVLRHKSIKLHRWFVDPIARFSTYKWSAGNSPIQLPVTFVCVCVLVTYCVFFVRGQDDPRTFISMPQALLTETLSVNRVVSSVEPGRFLAIEADSEHQLYERLNLVRERLSQSQSVITALDLLPPPNTRLSNYRLQESVYNEGGVVDELNRQLGMEGSELVAKLRTRYQESGERRPSINQLIDAVDNLPGALVTESGGDWFALVMFEKEADHQLAQSQVSQITGVTFIDTVQSTAAELKRQRLSAAVALGLSLIVLTVLMALIYGLRQSIRMVGVPAFSILFTVALLGLLGQSVTLFHTMALFMIIGLGMDYVIFLREMQDDSVTTRQAIVLSGLTTVVSFGLLSLSSIPVAQGFGLTVLIGNIVNLVIALGVFQPLAGRASTS